MQSLLRPLLATLALGSASPLRAGVLVVDASGGSPYTQISAAVVAASDGDIVLVRTGGYAGFSILGKSLDVVADAGASVQVNGRIVVSSIDVTRSVTLTGLSITGGISGASLVLSASTGSIRVQSCVVRGLDAPDCTGLGIDGGDAVSVVACDDTAFAACTLDGGDPADFAGYHQGDDGGDGLDGEASNVALYDCTLSGGNGAGVMVCPPYGMCSGGYGGIGGAGARVRTARLVFFSNSSVSGGNVGQTPCSPGDAGCPGSGMFVVSTGAGPSNARSLQTAFTVGGGTPGTLCLDPYGNVVVAPPSTHATLGGSSRRVAAARVVREQQPARVDFFGQPGDVVLLTVAESGRFLYSDALRGVSLVRAPKPAPVQIVGTIGPSGWLSSVWFVPDLGAGVQARRLLLQAQFVASNGEATLGSPATLVLLDAAF